MRPHSKGSHGEFCINENYINESIFKSYYYKLITLCITKVNGGINVVRVATLKREQTELLDQKPRQLLCPGCGCSGPSSFGSWVKPAGDPGFLSSYCVTLFLET